MSDTLVTAPDLQQQPALEPRPEPFLARVLNTFVAPIAMFRRFGPRPPWVDVMVVSTILGAIAFLLIPGEVWVNTMREAMQNNPQLAESGMDPEQAAGMQRIFGTVGAVLMPWILLFIQAGLLALVFNTFMGGNATYRQYLAVSAHAALIGGVGALATLPVMIGKGTMNAQITLGALAPGLEPTSFLYLFLSMLGVFALWQFAVVGMGAAAVNRRIPVGTGVAVVLGLFVLIIAAIAFFRAD